MFVQHCVKGVHGISDDTAQAMLDNDGIQSNWRRDATLFDPDDVRTRLTEAALDRHIHDYDAVRAETPFISLAAGAVSRVIWLRTNTVHSAIDTAIEFATDGGMGDGHLIYCWVIVGLNPAVEVEALAEEVRELHTYRRYSQYQTEGEITAKIAIPANQLQGFERVDASGRRSGWTANATYTPPDRLAALRDLF